MQNTLLTPSQLTWSVITGEEITTQEGICRVCGGPLVGEYRRHKKVVGDAWTDEYQCAALDSYYTCEACTWVAQNRSNLGLKIKLAMLISPTVGKKIYSREKQDVEQFLDDCDNGFEPPYLLILRSSPNAYKRHVIYTTEVSFDPHHAFVTIIADDVFTLPIDLRRLRPAAKEVKRLEDETEGKVYSFLNPHPLWHLGSFFHYLLER